MTMICNGVKLQIENGKVETTSISNFPGTFITIEINKNAPISLIEIIGQNSVNNIDFLLELP